MSINTEIPTSSRQSVSQPKWNTHSPTAGAIATAAVLEMPHHASP